MLKKRFLIYVMMFVLLIYGTLAQVQDADTDGDTIKDSYDKCQNTPLDEELPLYTSHPEYVGCSCSQILKIIGESDCRDFYCVSGSPVEIEDRIYSSKKPSCPIDFCLGDVFYDHPEPGLLLCVGGVPESYSCEPVVKKEYEGCINGSIPQFFELQEEEKDNAEIQPPVIVLNDEDKLEDRAFSLLLENSELRKSIELTGRGEFDIRMQETLDSVEILKETQKTKKMIGNKQVEVTIKKIIITPSSTKVLKNLLIFEEMPRSERLVTTDIVSEIEPLIVDTNNPILLVWKLDEVESETIITYQLNKNINSETTTLIIAEPANNILTVFLIPIVLIIIIGALFYYYFKKNIEDKRTIFK